MPRRTCIGPNGGYSRSLAKSMHKQKSATKWMRQSHKAEKAALSSISRVACERLPALERDQEKWKLSFPAKSRGPAGKRERPLDCGASAGSGPALEQFSIPNGVVVSLFSQSFSKTGKATFGKLCLACAIVRHPPRKSPHGLPRVSQRAATTRSRISAAPSRNRTCRNSSVDRSC